jgi:hypothetical protein
MTNSKRITTPRNLAAERYREILDRRGADEIRTLAHVKRFLERYVADPKFRDKLKENPEVPHLVVEAYGVRFDPRQALPLFRADHMRFRFSEEEARWPVAKAWDDYLTEMAECRVLHHRAGDPDANPEILCWAGAVMSKFKRRPDGATYRKRNYQGAIYRIVATGGRGWVRPTTAVRGYLGMVT